MAQAGDGAQVPLPPDEDEAGGQQHVPPPPPHLQEQFQQFQLFVQLNAAHQQLYGAPFLPPLPHAQPHVQQAQHVPVPQPHKVKLQQFWTHKPKVWFTNAEAEFDTCYVRDQRTMFNLVVKTLAEEALDRAAAIVEHPENFLNPYLALKQRLLEIYQMDPWECCSRLLHFRELGDWKPSQMMDAMLVLHKPEHLFKSIFLARIPADMRDHVQREAERLDCRELAAYADTIWQSRNANRANVLAALPLPSTPTPAGEEVDDLADEVAAVSLGRKPQHQNKKWKKFGGKRPPARQGGQKNQPQQKDHKGGVVCWRHLRFKENAWGCEDPNCYLFPGN